MPLTPATRFGIGLSLVIWTLATVAWSTEPSAHADASEIVVRAVDEAGVPQPGAALSLFCFDRDWRTLRSVGREVAADQSGVVRYDRLENEQTYVVRAKADGRIGFKQCILTGQAARQETDLVLAPAAAMIIDVRDEAGGAIGGAAIWELTHNGKNGAFWLDAQSLTTCGLTVRPSDGAGRLVLQGLPGGKVDFTLVHPEFAPAERKDIGLDGPTAAVIVLPRGVQLTLQVSMTANAPLVEGLMIDLRREPFDHPSSLLGRLPELRRDGTALVTVASGPYSWLRLTHPDYIATPTYSEVRGHDVGEAGEPFGLQPGSDPFTFQLRRKVTVRGRVLDEATGKPIRGESVQGELPAGPIEGPLARFASKWSHADWGETDERGEYALHLAAGRARITHHGTGAFAQSAHDEIDVQADGTNVAPDIRLSPLPKVRGVVLDADGMPLAKAVVRFRGSMLTYGCQPVATDEQGRFELTPPWIPVDLRTEERKPQQTLVAFDPYRPQFAQSQVRLDDPASTANVVLRMTPQEPTALLTAWPAELTKWMRGIVSLERQAHLKAITLQGKRPPELDGLHWLNTAKPAMSLSDFRGRYVLLQFWTTWCGPCHADLTSLKLLDELYKDRGLVVIGVHDNSMPLEAIRQDAAKHGMTWPIVVDHPDGRIVSRYKEHGVSGYPTYVLLDPNGQVLRDSTVPGPHLRSFKLEIIRQLLLPAMRGRE